MRTIAGKFCMMSALLLSLGGIAAQHTAEASFKTLYKLDGGADGMNPRGSVGDEGGRPLCRCDQR